MTNQPQQPDPGEIGGFTPPDLDAVFDTLAQTYDEPPRCPVAASLASTHAKASPELRRFVLAQIAHNEAEPWAAQVAEAWLRDNQEEGFNQ